MPKSTDNARADSRGTPAKVTKLTPRPRATAWQGVAKKVQPARRSPYGR